MHSVFLCQNVGEDQNNFIVTFQAHHTYCEGCKICKMAGRQAAILVAMGKLGIRELKPEQERVTNCLLEGHDVLQLCQLAMESLIALQCYHTSFRISSRIGKT